LLKVQEIRELIKLLDSTSISELTYEEKDCKIKLRKGALYSTVQPEVVVQAVPQQAPAVPVQTAAVAPKNEAPTPEVKEEPAKVEEKPSANIDAEGLHKIVSPMVGTFYAAPAPDEPPYVKVGDKINPDTIVCIVEAMKLFNEIEAEVKGEIVEVLVNNGQLVEYGQPLFLVKPE